MRQQRSGTVRLLYRRQKKTTTNTTTKKGTDIMTLYDELVARGLIAQVTDEEEIKELINNGKATFYIGFDPTADCMSDISWRSA